MKNSRSILAIALVATELSLAQVVEDVSPPCKPIPQEYISYSEGRCVVRTMRDHLALTINNESQSEAIMLTVQDAMVEYGFVNLSENIYWYPDNQMCYFSWFESSGNNLFFISSETFFPNYTRYCGYDASNPPKYVSTQFGSLIEQKMILNLLQNHVSIFYTNIESGSELYEEILANGGVPGLVTISDGEIINIYMEY